MKYIGYKSRKLRRKCAPKNEKRRNQIHAHSIAMDAAEWLTTAHTTK